MAFSSKAYAHLASWEVTILASWPSVKASDALHIGLWKTFSQPSLPYSTSCKTKQSNEIMYWRYKKILQQKREKTIDSYWRVEENLWVSFSRSALKILLRPPFAKTTKYQGNFRINGARTYNTLPRIIRQVETLSEFKIKLKHHFKQ